FPFGNILSMMKISKYLLVVSLWLFVSSCSSNNKTRSDTQNHGSDTVTKASEKQVQIIHHFKAFQTGEIINHIPCLQDNKQTFCLYLPKEYDTTKAWSVIYFFDAHARGKLPIIKYKELAEKYHLIIIGSNNSQNGLQPEAYDRIADILFSSTQTILNISQTNIITAGFSGGGKVAAGIALKNRSVTSVISCGAG